MGKDKKTTTTNSVDPDTQARQTAAWDAAQKYAKMDLPGVDSATTGALGNYQNAAAQGQTGVNALAGDQASIDKLMNPYDNDVVNGINAQWGQQSANVQNSIAGQFAKSGAFGGTRQGVATGVGLGQVANDQMQQIAGVKQAGYQNAMAQAGQLANLGMGANGAANQIGQYRQQLAAANQGHQANTLLGAANGLASAAHGSTSTQVQKGNFMADALGLAGTVGGFFVGGPAGASAGGQLGSQLGGGSPGDMGLNAGMNQQGGMGFW